MTANGRIDWMIYPDRPTGYYSSCHAVNVYSHSNFLFMAYRTSSGALGVKWNTASSTGRLNFVDSFYLGNGTDAHIDNVFAITPLSVRSEIEGLYFYPHVDGGF